MSKRSIDDLNASELRQLLEEKEKLLAGSFYATFNEVWTSEASTCKEADFFAMVRNAYPDYNTKDTTVCRPAKTTLEKALNDQNYINNDAGSARTSHNEESTKARIWPMHVLEMERPEGDAFDAPDLDCQDAKPAASQSIVMLEKPAGREDFVPSLNHINPDSKQDQDESPSAKSVHGEIAHLIPASPPHASLYYNVALLSMHLFTTMLRYGSLVEAYRKTRGKPTCSKNSSTVPLLVRVKRKDMLARV